MLIELLNLLREGGTRRISDLAHELGTTPELVEAMLEDLARMGYVKRVTTQCSDKCKTCPFSEKGCRVSSPGGNSGQIWMLVEQQESM